MLIPPLALDQFQTVRTVGVGSFSHGDLCYHVPSETFCVLKVMSKQRLIEQNQIEHIRQEREILEQIHHPNCVQYFGSFQDTCNVYMMMEYIPGGEVFAYLRSMERFDLNVARYYAAEILIVFQMLHEKGIIYRDLKPENLLFSYDGHLKFIDFGFAKRISDRTYTLCGTPEYLAPEILRGEGSSFSSDWWAFGVLVYEMLVGETPFVDQNENHMYHLICHGEFSVPIGVDEVTQDLLRGLLTVDATKRLGCAASGAEEIKSHPWFDAIEWDKVHDHVYDAPIIPCVADMSDSANYPEYTDQDLSDIPVTLPVTPDMFAGF
jgi:serine/threonine protein kinase